MECLLIKHSSDALPPLALWLTLSVNSSVVPQRISWGGRRMFLLGMSGAILCTLLFGMGGLPLFTLAWSLNRLLQSAGWVGMVKITSRWFSYSSYGAAMGLISLSYLFGDFFSRVFLGLLINRGMDWRQVFYVSAAVLGVIFITNFFLLKESPAAISELEPTANPANVFGTDGVEGTAASEGSEEGQRQEKKPSTLAGLMLPLLRNPIFWVVCILSFGFTLVRETFQNWTPTYLTEVAHMNKGDAATASSLFPLFGGISVLLVGFLSDRLGKSGRAVIILIGLLLSIPALLLMAYPPAIFGDSPLLTMMLLGRVAFVLIGPYSFLAGAISLDFGGKRGSATAAGWIDGIGYIGGILAGEVVGKMAQQQGWSAAFVFLACVTGLSSLASAVYWWQRQRPAP